MMQDNQINKLYRDTSYFEPSKFKMFVDDLSNLVISIKSKAIQQLFLQCSGYGYFQEGQKKIQTELKQNYISYLKQALDQCSCLKILKIQFNGFSIQDGSFLKIISLIQDIIKEQNRDIQILWIHTRLLRDCDVQMLGKLLNLSDYLIARNKIQQLSLQISGWQFKTGPLSNKQFLDLFGGFANNIMLMGQHNIKRFKLNISSLYMHELQAYNFLKQTIPQRNLIQSIENKRLQQRNNDQKKKSALREDRLNQHRQEIRRYLHLIDDKYAIEHPIPGKTKYISREPQFQKRKKEYIYQMLQANVRKMDLMKVLNEQMGMFEEHKQALKQIRKEVDQDMEEQAKRIREDQILIQQTSQIERRVADKFIKFPFDFVMAQRVQRFRQQIKDFVELLIERLSKMQELELDMRNWNDIFQMGELKKVLTIEFASGGIKPLLNKGSKIAQKKVFNQPEEESSKLKCTFIM